MASSSPAPLSSSFDPAVELHSEPSLTQGSSYDESDDLEGLQLQQEEAIASKTKAGVVIQHRAWKVPEVFRSDEDYPIVSPSDSPLHSSGFRTTVFSTLSSSTALTSSPRLADMPLISSPVAYPPSSSPIFPPEKRKRSLTNHSPVKAKKRLFGSGNELFRVFTESVESPQPNIDDSMGLSNVVPTNPHAPRIKVPFSEDNEGAIVHLGDLRSLVSTLDGEGLDSTPKDSLTPNTQPQHESFIDASAKSMRARTSSGKRYTIAWKAPKDSVSYEQVIAGRSTAEAGKATKSYYGIDIHELLDIAKKQTTSNITRQPDFEVSQNSVEVPSASKGRKNGRTMLWTEKYRARKFTDLVGDERTHRNVLRWLKCWDPIVFPGSNKSKPKPKFNGETDEERPQRKILLLTGPPGLGKTTLAHVCARQAGYEVVEINASDERSREVVKGKIRDCIGTENVKGINRKTAGGTVRRAGRPVCVVVDEVDGVVGGSSGSGEGGFMKALIDLVNLDQKNSVPFRTVSGNAPNAKKSKKGDRFRLLRPMILICNDVYHPALRPLRCSSVAEIIHIHKPPLDKVAARLKTVFDREGIQSDGDGVRRLCEAAWGISSRRESRANSSNTGEGDIRGILVVGEWVATKIRASTKLIRVTRKWVEQNILSNLSHGGGGSRGVGRGGAKEAVDRVFLEGAGFPKSTPIVPIDKGADSIVIPSISVSEVGKRNAMDRLREIIDTSGETDRIVSDCFAIYPTKAFQDDTFLSKPNAAYDWLHFHDTLSSKVHAGQEWELAPYLGHSVLAFHNLFAASSRSWTSNDKKPWDEDNEEEPLPFSGLRADYEAYEAHKQNTAIFQGLQSAFSVPLLRSLRSINQIATDFLPHLLRMLTPDVKPVIVGGSGEMRGTASVRKESERQMVQRSVNAMSAVGVTFERARVESADNSGVKTFIYRMEPPLDTLATFATAAKPTQITAPTRYAVRQVLDQEYQKHLILQRAQARQSRFRAGLPPGQASLPSNEHLPNQNSTGDTASSKPRAAKRDFFGRVVINEVRADGGGSGKGMKREEESRVWVSFHEGFSNAVRKPISLEELMREL